MESSYNSLRDPNQQNRNHDEMHRRKWWLLVHKSKMLEMPRPGTENQKSNPSKQQIEKHNQKNSGKESTIHQN
jgi:hypothetical protein